MQFNLLPTLRELTVSKLDVAQITMRPCIQRKGILKEIKLNQGGLERIKAALSIDLLCLGVRLQM